MFKAWRLQLLDTGEDKGWTDFRSEPDLWSSIKPKKDRTEQFISRFISNERQSKISIQNKR